MLNQSNSIGVVLVSRLEACNTLKGLAYKRIVHFKNHSDLELEELWCNISINNMKQNVTLKLQEALRKNSTKDTLAHFEK